MSKISVSRLNAYTECPQRYYLERVHEPRLPRRPAAWTARGNAVHDAVMFWEQGSRQDDLVPLALKLYDIEIEKAKAEQPDEKMWMISPRVKSISNDITYRREDTEKQAKWYQEYAEKSEWTPWELPDGMLAVEVPFEVIVSDALSPVPGQIDMIREWPDGTLEITDVKTGKDRGRDFQIGIYRFIAQKIFDIEIDYGRYIYSKLERESSPVNLRRYDQDYVTWLFSGLSEGIDRGLFLPNPGEQCKLCTVSPWCPEKGWLS